MRAIPDLLAEIAVEPEVLSVLRLAEELRSVVQIGGPAAAPALVAAVHDDDALLAISATHAVAALPGAVSDGVLLDSLGAPELWRRVHAAWALGGRAPQPAGYPGLVALLGSSSVGAMVAQRTLAGWARWDADAITAVLSDPPASDVTTRRRIVDTLGTVPGPHAERLVAAVATDPGEHPDVRVAAIAALGERGNRDVVALLRELSSDDVLGVHVLLALDSAELDQSSQPPRTDAGLRIGQFAFSGDLDPQLSRAGSGDTGGLASVVVGVGHALSRRDDVAHVITLGRATPIDELTALLTPDDADSVVAGVAFGPVSDRLPISEAWDHRLAVERGIRRALLRRPPLDVVHLRAADVGTLAASSVARRLGLRVVFTCAPDPHGPIALRQQRGERLREDFGEVDAAEHLWFRARMVERLVHQADHLVLFPRPDARSVLVEQVGVEPHRLDHGCTVAAEGIDLDLIEAAARRLAGTSTPGVVTDLLQRLPTGRRHLPIVLSVGRLHPAKGVERLVRDWLAAPDLALDANLVVVGGDLDHPNDSEQAVLRSVERLLEGHDASVRDGVVLLGARDHLDTMTLMAFAAGAGLGSPGGGVYVSGAPKEEFGLAMLEALASGLVVVGPAHGGPPTYLDDGETGVLVGPRDDLASAIRRGIDLVGRPGRVAAARARVERSYTVEAFAETLAGAYRSCLAGV